MEERKVLLSCKKMSSVVRLIDNFTENDRFYMIIEKPSGDTLKNTALKLGVKFLRESEVKKCMIQLLKIIKDLHR